MGANDHVCAQMAEQAAPVPGPDRCPRWSGGAGACLEPLGQASRLGVITMGIIPQDGWVGNNVTESEAEDAPCGSRAKTPGTPEGLALMTAPRDGQGQTEHGDSPSQVGESLLHVPMSNGERTL